MLEFVPLFGLELLARLMAGRQLEYCEKLHVTYAAIISEVGNCSGYK